MGFLDAATGGLQGAERGLNRLIDLKQISKQRQLLSDQIDVQRGRNDIFLRGVEASEGRLDVERDKLKLIEQQQKEAATVMPLDQVTANMTPSMKTVFMMQVTPYFNERGELTVGALRKAAPDLASPEARAALGKAGVADLDVMIGKTNEIINNSRSKAPYGTSHEMLMQDDKNYRKAWIDLQAMKTQRTAYAALMEEPKGSDSGDRIKMMTNQLTGEVERYNIDTGEKLPVGEQSNNFSLSTNTDTGIEQQGQQPSTETRTKSSGEKFITPEITELGTGAMSEFRNLWSIFAGGLFNPGLSSPKTVEARNKLKSFNQWAKSALAVNPRYPVAELAHIGDFLPEPSWFVDPDAGKLKVQNLITRLEMAKQSMADILQDNKRVVPKEQKAEYYEKINNIDMILDMIDVEQFKDGGQDQLKSAFDARALTPEVIDTLSREDIESLPIDEIFRYGDPNITSLLLQKMKEVDTQ